MIFLVKGAYKYRLNGIEFWSTTCKGQKYYLLSNNQIITFTNRYAYTTCKKNPHKRCIQTKYTEEYSVQR